MVIIVVRSEPLPENEVGWRKLRMRDGGVPGGGADGGETSRGGAAAGGSYN